MTTQQQNELRLVPVEAPSDWKKILSNSSIPVDALLTRLGIESHPLVDREDQNFSLRIPEPLLNKINYGDPDDPILLQVLPQLRERKQVEGYSSEPLLEQRFSPVKGLIHKYRSRALLVTTQACAIHCRYCFRRHFPYQEHQQPQDHWEQALDYVANNTQINEVILSGGDPLSLNDKHITKLLKRIDAIPSITRIRIHTRMLPSLPQRVTEALLSAFKQVRCKIILVAHCNHPNELGEDTLQAFSKLASCDVVLLNQSVLLRGINDDAAALRALSEKLFQQGVLPYYLFRLDKVDGAAHFDLPQTKAQTLYRELAASLPGFLTPKLAEEHPGEESKRLLAFD